MEYAAVRTAVFLLFLRRAATVHSIRFKSGWLADGHEKAHALADAIWFGVQKKMQAINQCCLRGIGVRRDSTPLPNIETVRSIRQNNGQLSQRDIDPMR